MNNRNLTDLCTTRKPAKSTNEARRVALKRLRNLHNNKLLPVAGNMLTFGQPVIGYNEKLHADAKAQDNFRRQEQLNLQHLPSKRVEDFNRAVSNEPYNRSIEKRSAFEEEEFLQLIHITLDKN